MDFHHSRLLVAIETDATRYHGEHARRPCVLNPAETEQMLAHLATDLAVLLPEIRHCAISMAGALYDQTQLLRPGYPVFSALESVLSNHRKKGEHGPLRLGIGADDGAMPLDGLQPGDKIPIGLLQTLPIVVNGQAELVLELSDSMEHLFLERGQLSAHSARALEANFGVAVNHARFMTVTDLNAMLHLQLEHFGFLALWELLDAAINSSPVELSVTGRGGQEFTWDGQQVIARFQTFDYWATQGPGRSVSGSQQMLAKAYSDWTREYRQFLATLGAHHVVVQQYLPGSDGKALPGSFFVENSTLPPAAHAAAVTEHSSGELGTVAVTVVSETGQFNYYPLKPQGLNDLHAAIRLLPGATGDVSFPGSIVYDQQNRCLAADKV